MELKEIVNILENWIPKYYAEKFDNVGLLINSNKDIIKNILITLDITELVIEEAISKKCNLIITYHPILLNGIKKITIYDRYSKIISNVIKNNISIYSIHTNLDNVWWGINNFISKKLKIVNPKVLIKKKDTLKKLITYVPIEKTQKIKNLLFDLGAGNIGNYDNCSFITKGIGSFRGKENSNPNFGKKNEINLQKENCINVIFPSYKEEEIKINLIKNHPYEEVPYEIFQLKNFNQLIGLGLYGDMEDHMSEILFFKYLKNKMNIKHIRHSNILNKKIKKIAFMPGSGRFAISNIKNKNIDAFISSDFKYHDFFENNETIIIDIGHFESEKFIKDIIYKYLEKKISNISIIKSKINTNPISYF